ncbi:MAG: zinc-ribbon domain-containing protein, partial [Ruminococcus sp.]
EDNFTVLLVICIIILVVSSITLAAGLINYKRKKIEQYSDATYVPDQTPRERPSVRNQADVKYCAKCGAKNPVQAVFCSKCGTHFYPVNGKNQ